VTRSRRIPTGRASSLRRGRAACALLAVLVACRSSGDEPTIGGPIVLGPGVEDRLRLEAAFVPAFDALQAAVDDGEDEVARRILAGIRARRPSAEVEEYAASFERVLDGRALVRDVDLRLASEPVEGAPGDLLLVLLAAHSRDVDVTLRLPAATLRRGRIAVDARGDDASGMTTETTDALGALRIPAGETVRVPLRAAELRLGGALCVRERWTLSTRAGFALLEEEELPAQDVAIEPCEVVRLAPFLPTAPVEPAELVRYLQDEQELFVPALMERAVRIAPERRGEALDLLAPVVTRMAGDDPERLTTAAPALRWLARSRDAGGDPVAWSAWFAGRTAKREAVQDAAEPEGGLDLPNDLSR